MSASFNYALVVLEIIKEVQTIQNTRTEIKLLQFKDLESLKINQHVPVSLNSMESLLFCWQSLRENGCLLSSRATTHWRQYPGINGHIRRDFGIYVLYIPRYPVSVSDGWFKLLEKRVSWIIRFDPVPIIPDVKYKNEVNFDIKIRFKAIDGSSQVVFLFILFVEACSDNIYKLNNRKGKKTIIQNVGFI